MPRKDKKDRLDYHREYKSKRLAAGICYSCDQPRLDDNTLCPSCRKKRNDFFSERYEKRKAAGLCPLCGKDMDTKSSKCSRCALASRERHANARKIVIAGYGGRCQCCGETEPYFLTIDHVNNDGAKERKYLSSSQLYIYLIRNGFPRDRYQLLCFNCNLGRQINGGICPHWSRYLKK